MSKKEYPSISHIVFTPKWYHYPITWAKNKFLRAKYTRQRKHRGYCDLDVWDLCDYLTSVMKNSIKQLAETHYGIPQHFLDVANGDEDLAHRNYTRYLETIVENLEILSRESNRSRNELINILLDFAIKNCEVNHNHQLNWWFAQPL